LSRPIVESRSDNHTWSSFLILFSFILFKVDYSDFFYVDLFQLAAFEKKLKNFVLLKLRFHINILYKT
jgi:hypothetical protein